MYTGQLLRSRALLAVCDLCASEGIDKDAELTSDFMLEVHWCALFARLFFRVCNMRSTIYREFAAFADGYFVPSSLIRVLIWPSLSN